MLVEPVVMRLTDGTEVKLRLSQAALLRFHLVTGTDLEALRQGCLLDQVQAVWRLMYEASNARATMSYDDFEALLDMSELARAWHELTERSLPQLSGDAARPTMPAPSIGASGGQSGESTADLVTNSSGT